MPEDDDLNYPLLNLDLLETLGDRFTVDDVAQSWMSNLPGGRVFTSERVAYRNLLDGIDPERVGATRNPFREWIGALMRGDVFGWTHPGRPRDAARLAFSDASLSHVREGIYGEMWVAGASAAAIVAVGAWISQRSREVVIEQFTKAQAAIAPIYTAADIVAEQQLEAIGAIRRVEDPDLGPILMTCGLFRSSEGDATIDFTGREPGADTDTVLGELGIAPDALARLRQEGDDDAPRG